MHNIYYYSHIKIGSLLHEIFDLNNWRAICEFKDLEAIAENQESEQPFAPSVCFYWDLITGLS